jgi:hypothetical protein|tara:strand:+ start:398 stop:643 length:246 start_codon:yes stop_codon:yes gene_type:complete
MAQCLCWKISPNPIIRPILLGEIVQNNKRTGFYAVFYFILGPFGHLKCPKKVLKGLHVARTYGPISKLENNPLNKLLGPFI